MKKILFPLLFVLAASASGAPVHAYGPGGPAPAMKEAAAAFEKKSGVRVEVTAGPADQWMKKAKRDADVIFSGSEHMMTSFAEALKGVLVEETIEPIYIRPSAILVRPGNPKGIAGLADLLKPGTKILVVNGAGQTGLWEDVAGRLGRIDDVRAFRRNIGAFAGNSGDAKKLWTSDSGFDAWLIWNIWEISNDDLADQVAIEPERRIWRDCGVALTKRGERNDTAKAFREFLTSPEGRAIFEKWGWQ
jgi:accessory colonization factor AcfC